MKWWLIIFITFPAFGHDADTKILKRPDFIHDIQPTMVNSGCSAISCHGSAVGRGGLKLSMFGADPKQDFDSLARESGARRLNIIEPEKSLLLNMLTGKLSHGAPALSQNSLLLKNISTWIKQGAVYDNKQGLKVDKITLSTPKLALKIGENTTLKAVATFSNGKKMDVTKYCYFETQNDKILGCKNKTVTARTYGEATIFVRYMHNFGIIKITVPQNLTFPFPKTAKTHIDKLVNAKLKQLGIPPSAVCSDEVFIRRIYLDLTGRLPSAKAAQNFLSSKDIKKREKLIDRILDSNQFSDYQALKWGDLLKCKAEFPSNLWPNAVQAYYRWMWTSVDQNKPFNKFVYELLTASGSNFRNPTVNFYRAFQKREPQRIAETASLLFMGTRFECARCHAHPKTGVKQLDSAKMSNFFSQLQYKKTAEWKEEIVYINRDKNVSIDQLWLPDKAKIKATKGKDLRVDFADWLTSESNPYFSKVIVNRVWFWLLGRGIVHDPDDFRDTNPPSNPNLLAFLENELKNSNFNLKHIFRMILNSDCYQRSSVPNRWNLEDKTFFSHYQTRRVGAEALIDAVCDITGIHEQYMSRVPEPFTFLPTGHRAVQLEDGTITSTFLEMFGRPARDSSYESNRSNNLTSKQVLHFLNSSHILDKISKSEKLKKMINSESDNKNLTELIYLTILSRHPTNDELGKVLKYLSTPDSSRRDSVNDLIWALFNTKEFIFNH